VVCVCCLPQRTKDRKQQWYSRRGEGERREDKSARLLLYHHSQLECASIRSNSIQFDEQLKQLSKMQQFGHNASTWTRFSSSRTLSPCSYRDPNRFTLSTGPNPNHIGVHLGWLKFFILGTPKHTRALHRHAKEQGARDVDPSTRPARIPYKRVWATLLTPSFPSYTTDNKDHPLTHLSTDPHLLSCHQSPLPRRSPRLEERPLPRLLPLPRRRSASPRLREARTARRAVPRLTLPTSTRS